MQMLPIANIVGGNCKLAVRTTLLCNAPFGNPGRLVNTELVTKSGQTSLNIQ